MKKVLLILSPFHTAPLAGGVAASLAVTLKSQGAKQVDLTSESHFNNAGRQSAYAVSDFQSVARNMANLMNEVIGACDEYNLNADMACLPDYMTSQLTRAATTCIRTVDEANDHIDRTDARSLAMIFFVALHNDRRYDAVVFPHLSGRASKALYAVGHNFTGLQIDPLKHSDRAVRSILLDNLRRKIADNCGEVYRARPANRLH